MSLADSRQSNYGPSIYVAAQVKYGENNEPVDYHVSLMQQESQAKFISNNYTDKACVSLNAIFVPYATYDTMTEFLNGGSGLIFPSGTLNGYNEVIEQPVVKTLGLQYDSDDVTNGNIVDENVRGVGINKDVYFVSTSSGVAGPLNIDWDGEEEKWVMGASSAFKPVVCFCTDALISEPSLSGYTEFNTTAGVARNYDPNLRVTSAENIVIYGAFVTKLYAGTTGGGIAYSGAGFILPYYIGCPE